jgi:hypothetical protein
VDDTQGGQPSDSCRIHPSRGNSGNSLLRNSSFKSYVRLGNAKVEIDEEQRALRQALAQHTGGVAVEGDYHEIMRDLARLGVGKIVTAAGRTYYQRTPLTGHAYEAFAAVGMRPPARVLASSRDTDWSLNGIS